MTPDLKPLLRSAETMAATGASATHIVELIRAALSAPAPCAPTPSGEDVRTETCFTCGAWEDEVCPLRPCEYVPHSKINAVPVPKHLARRGMRADGTFPQEGEGDEGTAPIPAVEPASGRRELARYELSYRSGFGCRMKRSAQGEWVKFKEAARALSEAGERWIPAKHLADHSEPVVYAKPNGHDKWHVGIAYWTVSNKWSPAQESKLAPDGFTHYFPLPATPKPGERSEG